MSYQEFVMWQEYARMKGGIHHTDRLLATICTQVNRFGGGEAELSDFLPELAAADANEQEASIGEIMNILAMAAN